MGTLQGHEAEDRASVYLEAQGLQIIARNWRNRWCEIDIVAQGKDTIHIVEVKYRARSQWGGAAEYVTPDKIERLRRAATAWQQANRYGGSIQIDVVAIEGTSEEPTITWLTNVVLD